MNAWLIAAACMVFLLIPCGIVCFSGRPVRRLVALELTGDLAVLIMAFFAEGIGRPSFLDLPLTLAFLTFAGGLVFARFLETWR